ncbi:MAG: hypothetical protein IK027_01400 [Deltaproteobacteria bacterium]|nr:hypothetical protein [Deltaproteobacteria bacterium]
MNDKLLREDDGMTTQEAASGMPPLVQESPLLPDEAQTGTLGIASEPGEPQTFILDETDLVAEDEGSGEDSAGEKLAAQAAALPDETLAALVQDAVRMRVDAMAKKLVERVAWEVVPDLAESLVKEEIRNLKLPRA